MYAMGVDIGGTKIAAGVVDESGTILARDEQPTPATPDSIDVAITGLYNNFAASHDLSAVGIAAAGLVSSDRATVMFAPNVNWRSHAVANRVRALTGTPLPVFVENDANAAGWAELRFGAGRGVDDMLMLTIGTGVGGSAISGGRIIRGAYGAATEVGHIQVVDGGHQCGCGQYGCLEAYASGIALERMGAEALADDPERARRLSELAGEGGELRGVHITQGLNEGDPLCAELIDRLGVWVGRGAASLVAVLDPAIIVIGGGIASVGDPLFSAIRRGLTDHLTGRDHRPVAEVVPAGLANDAGIVGAADLARTTVSKGNFA